MSNKLKKVFGLDPEYNKQLEESMREAEEKALKEKWCCTCEYYIPVDPCQKVQCECELSEMEHPRKESGAGRTFSSASDTEICELRGIEENRIEL